MLQFIIRMVMKSIYIALMMMIIIINFSFLPV